VDEIGARRRPAPTASLHPKLFMDRRRQDPPDTAPVQRVLLLPARRGAAAIDRRDSRLVPAAQRLYFQHIEFLHKK
jgi:hypothetical protein